MALLLKPLHYQGHIFGPKYLALRLLIYLCTMQTPSIVMSEDTFDLVSTNEHLYTSETMLWIISQIMALWNVRVQLSAGLNQMVAPTGSGNPSSMSGSETADGLMGQCWRPWDHIFPQPKGQATPSYNPAGKYCVRLYWMVRILHVY